MDARSGGTRPAPGLWGFGLATAFLCACAAGAEEFETSDAAVGAGDADLEQVDASDGPPFGSLDATLGFDGSYAFPDTATDDAVSEASTEDTGRADAGASSDTGAPLRDAGSDSDGGAVSDAGNGSSDASSSADASADAGGRSDASADAGRDSGGGTTGGTTGGGGTPGGGTCNPEKCTNQCSVAAPFRCCTRDNRCGCSWFSVAYCND
jgi:hypothetical protein